MARITPAELRLARELVFYRVKVKEGERFLGRPASLFRKLYKAQSPECERRPPSGTTGMTTSRGVDNASQRMYAAMAADLVHGVQLGAPPKEATMAVFRHARHVWKSHGGAGQLCINRWLALVRNLQAGVAALFRCRNCGARVLVERNEEKFVRLKCCFCFHDSGMIDLAGSRVRGAR